MATFPDETACRTYLAMRRWLAGPVCPKCGNTKVYESTARPFHWQCRNKTDNHSNPYRFSIISGTVFENTNIPLVTWFKVLYTMLQSKKGISSRQLRRMFFGETSSLHTAWYVGHRLRVGMHDPEFKKLMGIVEVDETFIGGKEKNKHASKRKHQGSRAGKIGVIGAISRKGNVVCQIIENVQAGTLHKFVRKVVSDAVELVATDENPGYQYLRDIGYLHETVRHSMGEYVRGQVHTANLDSFWSLFKRGIMGSFQHVSKKYLPLYLAEFQFRHNNRKNLDIFGEAIAGC